MSVIRRSLSIGITVGIAMMLGFIMTISLGGAATAEVNTTTIYYAAPTPVGQGDCTSWENACYLYWATQNVAQSNSEIWVKEGVHYPDFSANPSGNPFFFFELQSGVAIYGGFSGNETSRSQRDPVNNVTVLSGDVDKNDITDSNGVVLTTTNIVGENSYNVVRTDSVVDNTAVLDGFTITGGHARGDEFARANGGGIYMSSSDPILNNLIIQGNLAERTTQENGDYGSGGGIYNGEGSPTISNSVIQYNMATNLDGGGGYHGRSNSQQDVVTFNNVQFNHNHGTGEGGALNHGRGDLILNDVSFDHNSSGLKGGALYVFGITNYISLTNVLFTNNTATTNGGAIWAVNMQNASFQLENVTLRGNSAGEQGGGMYASSTINNLTLNNVVFSGNSAADGGGFYSESGVNAEFTHATFNGNQASNNGGALNVADSTAVTLTNSLIWGNKDSSGTGTADAGISASGVTPVVSYSIYQGSGGSESWSPPAVTDGGNNLDVDPLFTTAVNPDNAPTTAGSAHLGLSSPAIDVARNGNCSNTDLDGQTRPIDGNADSTATCDMGAYEAGSLASVNLTGTTVFEDQPGIEVAVENAGTLEFLYIDAIEGEHPESESLPGFLVGSSPIFFNIEGLSGDQVTPATGFTLTLTLPHDNLPNPTICRYDTDASAWDCAADSFTSTTVTRSGITGFSDWLIGEIPSYIYLPTVIK